MPSSTIAPEVGASKSGNAFEQRGLAGARRADDANELALADAEADVADRLDGAARILVDLAQPLHLEHGLRGSIHRSLGYDQLARCDCRRP